MGTKPRHTNLVLNLNKINLNLIKLILAICSCSVCLSEKIILNGRTLNKDTSPSNQIEINTYKNEITKNKINISTVILLRCYASKSTKLLSFIQHLRIILIFFVDIHIFYFINASSFYIISIMFIFFNQ